MIEIAARTLTATELPSKADAAVKSACVKQSKDAPGGCVLVHDGKQIIVEHGPEDQTICGNPAYKMMCGSKEEIAAEKKKLNLKIVGTIDSVLRDRSIS